MGHFLFEEVFPKGRPEGSAGVGAFAADEASERKDDGPPLFDNAKVAMDDSQIIAIQ